MRVPVVPAGRLGVSLNLKKPLGRASDSDGLVEAEIFGRFGSGCVRVVCERGLLSVGLARVQADEDERERQQD